MLRLLVFAIISDIDRKYIPFPIQQIPNGHPCSCSAIQERLGFIQKSQTPRFCLYNTIPVRSRPRTSPHDSSSTAVFYIRDVFFLQRRLLVLFSCDSSSQGEGWGNPLYFLIYTGDDKMSRGFYRKLILKNIAIQCGGVRSVKAPLSCTCPLHISEGQKTPSTKSAVLADDAFQGDLFRLMECMVENTEPLWSCTTVADADRLATPGEKGTNMPGATGKLEYCGKGALSTYDYSIRTIVQQ